MCFGCEELVHVGYVPRGGDALMCVCDVKELIADYKGSVLTDRETPSGNAVRMFEEWAVPRSCGREPYATIKKLGEL